MILVVVSWVAVGVIVGLIVSRMVNLRGDDPRFGIGAAVAGAFVAGALFRMIGDVAVPAWNPWNLLFAAVGAIGAVVLWHAIRSRYASHEPYSTRRSY